MYILKLNDYTTPSPSGYSVEYDDVNGDEQRVEDGTTYIERVRTDVPKINVSWTNLTQDEATAITTELAKDIITVSYFYGTILTADMTASARSLKLKFVDGNGASYWDASVELKG